MAQKAGPYGFRIAKMLGDVPFSGGIHTIPLNVTNTYAFYFGDPLGLSGGNPVALTASPVPPATYLAAATANNPIGIFMGCSYQDPKMGFVNDQFLPANAAGLGYTNIQIKVFDSPSAVMQIQANGIVTVDKIGMNAGLTGFHGGNAQIKNSVCVVDTATVGTAVGAVRIYDFVYTPSPAPGMSSQPGDPFTDLLVIWAPGVHRYAVSQGL